ncbi:MAG: hypothetical protein IT361_00055 [Gemmatimonadaceae bacterium]|nr:hypothetical protein [Gemmatimonadaceae bacterium]
MPPRWPSEPDATPDRDTAMLAEVLRTLRRDLEAAEGQVELTSEEVQDLVASAVAGLQRLDGQHAPMAAIAPVLGAGVLQELLRQRRERSPRGPAAPSTVDAKR